MKLEILKKHLEEIVQIISRVSNKNLSLPVLGCILISASPTKTTMRATNLDVSVEFDLKTKVLKEGVVAVPAQIFNQSISTITDEKITLEVVDSNLHIVGSHGVSKLKTIDHEDFPTLPYVKDGEGVSLTINTKEFLRAIKSTSFAVASSGMRPELSSVFLGIFGGVLTAAATDSFRLAEIKIQTKTKQDTEPILLPARNIQDIVRVVSSSDVVEIRIGENQATYVANGNYITTRIIDGAFPEYQKIIPKNFTTSATFLTEDILTTLKRVSVFVDQTGQVEFSLSSENKKFMVRATNTQVGETYESVDATIEGEDLTMYFNARYILDALNVVSTDSVSFKFSGVGKPLIVSEVPEKGFTYLVMPMNK